MALGVLLTKIDSTATRAHSRLKSGITIGAIVNLNGPDALPSDQHPCKLQKKVNLIQAMKGREKGLAFILQLGISPTDA